MDEHAPPPAQPPATTTPDSREPLHARLPGEHAAYYFDPAELGVTTTSEPDESW